MVVDNIWNGFTKLFPDYVDKVESYKKIGSKSIKLKMKTPEGTPDKFLIFLYNDPYDWTFGTKVWRRKPQYKKSNIDQVLNELPKEEA
jgi:hypothetical protein